MAPKTVLDYIVVHELTRLRPPSHTAVFKNSADKGLPDYHRRKAWLRVCGTGMDSWIIGCAGGLDQALH
jgi:predicted metal-dependent hydrolase